jgi:hypothetical protein
VILGLDVSTSITGATVLDMEGEMVYNRSWDTRNKNKFPTLYDKADFIKQQLWQIDDLFFIKKVFVEQSLNSFRSGFSSAQTLSTLSRFNGIVSWICYEVLKLKPEPIQASSARKQVGVSIKRGENAKEKSLKFVIDTEPTFLVEYTKFGNPRPGVADRSDSYIIAKAGLLSCSKK